MKDNITTLFNEQFRPRPMARMGLDLINQQLLEKYVDDILDFILSEVVPMVRKETLAEAIRLVGTHTEQNGDYCDTGKDMEWACRSKCVDMAIGRLTSLSQETNECLKK